MRRTRVAVAVTFAAGALLALAGARLEREALTFLGLAVIGGVGVLIGLDTLRSRRLVTVSRSDRRASETWAGVAAVGQGVAIGCTGLFLTAVSALALLGAGHAAVRHVVRHPGVPLLAFAALCLAAATTTIAGSVEERQGSRRLVLLNLATSRLLPGLILVLLGLAAASLGLLEITSPATFDRLGGGFLEVLFAAGR